MKKIILLFALIILTSSASYSQIKIVLGPTLGYTLPTGDYSGNTSDFYTGTKYGQSSNINFGVMGKLALGPINFNLSAIYTPMSNSGVSDVTHPNSTVEIKQSLFTIAVGSQFGFGVPLAPIKPYIGFDILFSTISGSYKFQGTTGVTSSNIEMETASRTGLGIAAGVELKLMSTALDLSLRYNMINLFSKKYEGSLTNNNREEAYRFLNDAKDPNYGTGSSSSHPIGSDRSITTVQLQLGVLFGF
jgi:opacity protein-like surface antigen